MMSLYRGREELSYRLSPYAREEWFWYKLNASWYGWGAGIRIMAIDFSASNFAGFEFTMPLEILEGSFNLIFEDNMGVPVGNQIVIPSNELFRYLSDGSLTIPLSEVVKFEQGNRRFNWGSIRQIKFEPSGQVGRAIVGKPVIKRPGSRRPLPARLSRQRL